jgi:hypothetical protein
VVRACPAPPARQPPSHRPHPLLPCPPQADLTDPSSIPACLVGVNTVIDCATARPEESTSKVKAGLGWAGWPCEKGACVCGWHAARACVWMGARRGLSGPPSCPPSSRWTGTARWRSSSRRRWGRVRVYDTCACLCVCACMCGCGTRHGEGRRPCARPPCPLLHPGLTPPHPPRPPWPAGHGHQPLRFLLHLRLRQAPPGAGEWRAWRADSADWSCCSAAGSCGGVPPRTQATLMSTCRPAPSHQPHQTPQPRPNRTHRVAAPCASACPSPRPPGAPDEHQGLHGAIPRGLGAGLHHLPAVWLPPGGAGGAEGWVVLSVCCAGVGAGGGLAQGGPAAGGHGAGSLRAELPSRHSAAGTCPAATRASPHTHSPLCVCLRAGHRRSSATTRCPSWRSAACGAPTTRRASPTWTRRCLAGRGGGLTGGLRGWRARATGHGLTRPQARVCLLSPPGCCQDDHGGTSVSSSSRTRGGGWVG